MKGPFGNSYLVSLALLLSASTDGRTGLTLSINGTRDIRVGGTAGGKGDVAPTLTRGSSSHCA